MVSANPPAVKRRHKERTSKKAPAEEQKTPVLQQHLPPLMDYALLRSQHTSGFRAPSKGPASIPHPGIIWSPNTPAEVLDGAPHGYPPSNMDLHPLVLPCGELKNPISVNGTHYYTHGALHRAPHGHVLMHGGHPETYGIPYGVPQGSVPMNRSHIGAYGIPHGVPQGSVPMTRSHIEGYDIPHGVPQGYMAVNEGQYVGYGVPNGTTQGSMPMNAGVYKTLGAPHRAADGSILMNGSRYKMYVGPHGAPQASMALNGSHFMTHGAPEGTAAQGSMPTNWNPYNTYGIPPIMSVVNTQQEQKPPTEDQDGQFCCPYCHKVLRVSVVVHEGVKVVGCKCSCGREWRIDGTRRKSVAMKLKVCRKKPASAASVGHPKKKIKTIVIRKKRRAKKIALDTKNVDVETKEVALDNKGTDRGAAKDPRVLSYIS